tara:strand:- start:310 stop:618 length:309 start_codon:yes stop_codon:yes gene_type:complete
MELGLQGMDSFGVAVLSPHLGMTKRQRVIAEEETSFISANQIKVFTIKVIDPDKKDDKATLVFQRASSAAKAVEIVKEKNPEWKCLVIDSHEPKPWRRDERY